MYPITHKIIFYDYNNKIRFLIYNDKSVIYEITLL